MTILRMKLRGHDAEITVTYYAKVKPNPRTWDSDWDYHGYVDFEYSIEPKWLEPGLTEEEHYHILAAYEDNLEKEYLP